MPRKEQPKSDSEKALAFKSRAASRTSKVLKGIRAMGPLAGKNYESTKEQRDAVYTAINKEVASLKARWEAPQGSEPAPEFSFDPE